MGKIFPDGKGSLDPVTHKILKPSDWEERFVFRTSYKRELDRRFRNLSKEINKKIKRFGQFTQLFLIKMTFITCIFMRIL